MNIMVNKLYTSQDQVGGKHKPGHNKNQAPLERSSIYDIDSYKGPSV